LRLERKRGLADRSFHRCINRMHLRRRDFVRDLETGTKSFVQFRGAEKVKGQLFATGPVNLENGRTRETHTRFKQTQGLSILTKGGQEPVGLFPRELNHAHLRHHDRPAEDRGDGQAQKHHLSRDRRVLEGKNESAGREKMQRGNQLRHSALVIAELARNERAESWSRPKAIRKMTR